MCKHFWNTTVKIFTTYRCYHFFVWGSVANPSSSRKKEADLIRGQKKLIFISNEGEAQEEERRTYALFKALSALAIRET